MPTSTKIWELRWPLPATALPATSTRAQELAGSCDWVASFTPLRQERKNCAYSILSPKIFLSYSSLLCSDTTIHHDCLLRIHLGFWALRRCDRDRDDGLGDRQPTNDRGMRLCWCSALANALGRVGEKASSSLKMDGERWSFGEGAYEEEGKCLAWAEVTAFVGFFLISFGSVVALRKEARARLGRSDFRPMWTCMRAASQRRTGAGV
jgi:hypothetical protein